MEHDEQLAALQRALGVTFNNVDVLRTALTHRSYVNENRHAGVREHNERLEFLGDAVLELITTEFLYTKFPDKPEGELTALRAALVNTDSICDAAIELGINNALRLSRGEARDTGRARRTILANAFEAVLGAAYLDGGYAAAKVIVDVVILPKIDTIIEKRLWIDAKSYFQEKAQEILSVTPTYELVDSVGPDHDKLFVCVVKLGDDNVAEGRGKSKQEAETMAARNALEVKGW
jgi:ribonuclease-3